MFFRKRRRRRRRDVVLKSKMKRICWKGADLFFSFICDADKHINQAGVTWSEEGKSRNTINYVDSLHRLYHRYWALFANINIAINATIFISFFLSSSHQFGCFFLLEKKKSDENVQCRQISYKQKITSLEIMVQS